MSIAGFDVSTWQDNDYTPQKIDFNKMKDYGKFVIIRQGQGWWTDEDFSDYWRDAKAAGMVRMAYHFFTWDTSPELQAEKFYNDLKNDPPNKIRFEGREISGYWGDFEWWQTTPSNAMDLFWRFAVRMRELTGMYPGIYTAPGFWNSYGRDEDKWAELPLWIARWGATAPGNMNPWQRLGRNPAIWQWGTPAIGKQVGCESEEVDANWFMGTESDLSLGGDVVESKYEVYGKVLYVKEDSEVLSVENMQAYDAIIIKGTIGEGFAAKYVDHAKVAKAAGRPVLLWVESWNDLYTEWATFPTDNKLDTQLKYVREAIAILSGYQIKVYGVVLDASMLTWRDDLTKFITDVNLVKTTDYLMEIIARFCQVPVFLYMSNAPLRHWVDSIHICGLWDRRSISFYGPVPLLVNGVPPTETDLAALLAYYPVSDWKFWLYRYNLASKSYSGIYRGTKENLYTAIKYVPGEVPPPIPDPEEPPVTDTLEKLKEVFGEFMSLLKQYLKE